MAADVFEDASGGSSIQVDYELSTLLFDVITSTENSAVIIVTTDTHSTPILPITTSIITTEQLDSVTVLLETTDVLSTNTKGSGAIAVNQPTSIPSETSSSSFSNTGVIIGGTVGTIILVAVITVIVGVIAIRKKRVERKYQINQTQQAGGYNIT